MFRMMGPMGYLDRLFGVERAAPPTPTPARPGPPQWPYQMAEPPPPPSSLLGYGDVGLRYPSDPEPYDGGRVGFDYATETPEVVVWEDGSTSTVPRGNPDQPWIDPNGEAWPGDLYDDRAYPPSRVLSDEDRRQMLGGIWGGQPKG